MINKILAMLALMAFSFCLSLPLHAQTVSPAQSGASGQAVKQKPKVKIRPGQLLVRPKNAARAPKLLDDPRGWVRAKQRFYYNKMARAMGKIRSKNSWAAAWVLIFMSFVYGVLHAAGPGHGKAVVSAWLLANEQQLRRGIIIAALAAMIQAVTAIVLVSVLVGTVVAIGTKARFIASSLTAISFAMIALVGLYLIYHVLKTRPVFAVAGVAHNHNHDHAHGQPHDHVHHHHAHHHAHAHDEHCQTHHDHAADCDCGHAHMPSAAEVADNWSWKKAFALAFAVGIRPCSGAILVLLLASTFGIYWAGIAATFAMAVGTGITVSLAAVLAVTSKNLALKLTGERAQIVDKVMFGVKLLAGIFITLTGAFLFWGTLPT